MMTVTTTVRASVLHLDVPYLQSGSFLQFVDAANSAICSRTSVCVTNAVMLLMKLESKRYNEMRDAVWKHVEGGAVLKPRG